MPVPVGQGLVCRPRETDIGGDHAGVALRYTNNRLRVFAWDEKPDSTH
jgi:hypothetical protein